MAEQEWIMNIKDMEGLQYLFEESKNKNIVN
jgi:hypothetical protein